jgi:phasin
MDTNKTASARSTNTDATRQLRDMAETGAKQSKEVFEKVSVATTNTAEMMTNFCSTALKGIQDYNSKLVEFAQENTKTALEFVQSLSVAKSPSECVEVSTEHARHQLETMAEQTKQLAMLTQHITIANAEPLKTGLVKAFNRAA